MNLAHHYPLRAVYNKGAPLGHQRNITHVDIFLSDFAGFQEYQIDPGLNRHGEGGAFVLALHLAHLDIWLIEDIVVKLQTKVSGGAFNGKRRLENLLKTLTERWITGEHQLPLKKPFIGRELNINQIGQLHYFGTGGPDFNPVDSLFSVKHAHLPKTAYDKNAPPAYGYTGGVGDRKTGSEIERPY